jgi:hypothetical protein
VQLIPHNCPACQFATPAPVASIAQGRAGIFQCEACNRAYDIQIEFHEISQQQLAELRQHSAGSAEIAVDSSEDEAIARLKGIQSQIANLRAILSQLESEAMRLEGENGMC